MDKKILQDFENNRAYTEELLDGIPSGISLFLVSDEIKFLHFNQAADEMFGYEKGGLLALTNQDSLSIFHPDYVDLLYDEIIATLRDGRLFNYNCRVLCRDGSYKWTNLSAELIQQKEGGRLYFYCVLSPTHAPKNTLLKGCHFLLVTRCSSDLHFLSDLIEHMGGTCDTCHNGLEALELFTAPDSDHYDSVFIDSRLPVLNGFELAKEIRCSQELENQSIPLVMLVYEEDEESIEASEDLNIDAFVRKPLNKEALSPVFQKLSKLPE